MNVVDYRSISMSFSGGIFGQPRCGWKNQASIKEAWLGKQTGDTLYFQHKFIVDTNAGIWTFKGSNYKIVDSLSFLSCTKGKIVKEVQQAFSQSFKKLNGGGYKHWCHTGSDVVDFDTFGLLWLSDENKTKVVDFLVEVHNRLGANVNKYKINSIFRKEIDKIERKIKKEPKIKIGSYPWNSFGMLKSSSSI